jgi:uncharacterized coiled-coil DUF342 family protein
MAEKENEKGILKGEIEKLEQLRDELRVQAHLFKADMKKEYEELDKKFQKVKRDANPVRRAARETADEVSEATRLLFDTVLDGMKRLRKSLK